MGGGEMGGGGGWAAEGRLKLTLIQIAILCVQ